MTLSWEEIWYYLTKFWNPWGSSSLPILQTITKVFFFFIHSANIVSLVYFHRKLITYFCLQMIIHVGHQNVQMSVLWVPITPQFANAAQQLLTSTQTLHAKVGLLVCLCGFMLQQKLFQLCH